MKKIHLINDIDKMVLSIHYTGLNFNLREINTVQFREILGTCKSSIVPRTNDKLYVLQVATDSFSRNTKIYSMDGDKGNFYTMFGFGYSISEAISNLKSMIDVRLLQHAYAKDFTISDFNRKRRVTLDSKYIEVNKSGFIPNV